MAAPWIVQSKIGAPSPGDGYVRRGLLPMGAPPPVTLLVAGPGYGKTLGLLGLVEGCAGYETAWFTFDELDREPGVVFRHLVAAVQARVPPFGAETLAVLGASQPDLRLAWQVFFQELAGYNLEPGLLLCLDDFHHAARAMPDFAKALYFFFDKLPKGVHVALTSRERLALPYARLAGRGRLMELGPEELRLSSGEAERVWRAQSGGEPPEGWRDQVRAYDGWPLGVAYAASGGAARPGATLAAYVAEEFYAAQPQALRDVLLRLALLQAPGLHACGQIFDVPEVAERLERLEAAHLVQRGEDGSYRLPTYLRDFLAVEAGRVLGAVELAAFHRRAGAYYAGHEQPEVAFGHRVEARDWVGAIATARSAAPAMLARGRHAQLQRWLEALPDRVRREPWPSFWWGQVAWRAGDGADARASFERSLAGFRRAADRPGEAKAAIRLLTIATHLEDEAALPGLEADAREVLPHGGDEDRADWNLLVAMGAEQAGHLAGWQAANERVLGLPVGTNIEVAQCAAIACMNLFTLELHRGNWARARAHVEEAVAIATRWEFRPEQLYAGFMRTHMHVAEGDLDAASAFLRALPEAWEEALDWHDRACALTVLGAYHQALGDLKAADQALARATGVFEKAGYPLGKKVPLERQAWVALQRGQPARALKLVAEGGELERGSVYDLVLRLVRARALDLAGEASAREAFEELEADARAMKAPLPLARALLYAAAAHRRAGRADEATAKLDEALAEITAGDLGFLRRQDQQLWSELADAPPTEAAGLDVRLFGTLEARVDGVLLDRWPRRKAKVLLAALVLAMVPDAPSGRRGLSGGELASVMGEKGLDGVQACAAALRRQLEPALTSGARSRYVPFDGERYGLAVGAGDVADFEGAIAQARAHTDPAAVQDAYERAVALYRGNLLDEPFFAPFFQAERARYQAEALAALRWLVDRYVFLGDEGRAGGCLERAIALAPHDEAVAIWAMRHHGLRRQPERVRHVYWDYRKALHRALGVAPSAELEAAYQGALS